MHFLNPEYSANNSPSLNININSLIQSCFDNTIHDEANDKTKNMFLDTHTVDLLHMYTSVYTAL